MIKDIILFDLDGTLSNGDHRTHHILKSPKDWRSFFAECDKDKPHKHVIEILNVLDTADYEIWIVSGRSDEVRDKTIIWLHQNGIVYHKLIMRKKGDYTDDSVLKISWLYNGLIPKERVMLAFDDRDRVVEAWRKEGIPCFQVAAGDF